MFFFINSIMSTFNSSRHINENYAVCDSHIAIIRENSVEKGMMIYIYQLLTDINYFDAQVTFNINNCTKIRRLKYSNQNMDINYSKCYMSLSRDGKYLAISWLPNPAMSSQSSMQYCSIYDLSALPFENTQQIKNQEQNHLLPILPIQLIGFHGACVFMTGKKLALLNRSQVRVYQMEQGEEDYDTKTFFLDFSVEICRENENVALFPGYNYCRFTKTYALVRNDNTRIDANHNSANFVLPAAENCLDVRNLPQKCPDDNVDLTQDTIGFGVESSNSENKDEQEYDDDMAIDDIEIDIFDHHDIALETAKYEMFCKEHRFIKSNIETIKSAGIINVIVNEQTGLLLWSLQERKLVFFDRLKSSPYIEVKDQQQEYVFAFTPRKNQLAFAKRYCRSQDTSKPVNNTPILSVRDADSGIVVSQLHLPPDRLMAGISQIEFLQNGMYIMVISYSHVACYFDLFDTASESHLDSYSFKINNHINIDQSIFILNNRVPLRHGCGVFLIATIITDHIIDKSGKIISQTITEDSFIVNTVCYRFKKISFFQDAFENFNRRGHQICCNESNALWTLKKLEESRSIHVLQHSSGMCIHNEKTEESCPAYFLDTDRNYLMTYTQLHESTCSALTIWKISSAGKVWQTERNEFDQLIRLEEVVYSFPQNVKCSLSTIVGYPSILFNLTCISRDDIVRMNPVVIRPDNAEGIPVLIITLNDPMDIKDYGGVYSRKRRVNHSQNTNSQQFTLAIPLNSYATLDCHLHALANECEFMASSKQRFLRDDLAKIPSRLLCTGNLTPTWQDLLKLIDNNLEYFSTLAGYAAICRLARSDTYNDLLSKILQTSTKVGYCTIARAGVYTDHWYTDPLMEAISTNSRRNITLIKQHIEQSVTDYGLRYATLLIKHRKLLDSI